MVFEGCGESREAVVRHENFGHVCCHSFNWSKNKTKGGGKLYENDLRV